MPVTTDLTLREALDARHSARAFASTPVPRDVIESILTTAQRAPSWCNSQPWQVVVSSGGAIETFRQALASYVETHEMTLDLPGPTDYVGVYGERRREAGYALYRAVGIERSDRTGRARQAAENFSFFGAPHVAVITTDRDLGVYGAVDCGGYVSTLLLAAQEYGVATVPQASIAMYSDFVRAHLGIPEDRVIVCAVSFGYEDDTHPVNAFRTSRADIAEVVTWND